MNDRLPDVGDLVLHAEAGDSKWVVHDITGKGQPTAAWTLRPLYGGGADAERNRTVPGSAVSSIAIIRRRGEWTQP
ncbi:hypothetical protein AB0B07_23265 [Streptomyces sioyaensis]|uniref:hypothetical protein n=1 Tax=Streptomyces sioyaensis TaxID=67364 RepID=UPI0033EC056C